LNKELLKLVIKLDEKLKLHIKSWGWNSNLWKWVKLLSIQVWTFNWCSKTSWI